MLFLFFILLLIFISLSALIYKISKNETKGVNKILYAILSMVVLAVGLEISVFNVNFYESYKYESTDLSSYISAENEDYTILSQTDIEFPEINNEIKNIKIELSPLSPEKLEVTPFLTDEANEFYFEAPTHTIYRDIPQSHFINIETTGKSSHLKLNFTSDEEIIQIMSISVNEARPFNFSVFRLLTVIAALLFIYAFNPSSPIYSRSLKEYKTLKSDLTIAFVAIECIIFVILGTLNPVFLGIDKTENGFELVPLSLQHHNQYDELAQAILDGKAYIDNDDVPQSLIDMENPYDTTARRQQSALTGDKYRWDVAYFNGHYYVYFGIVPLLLMYLPCRLLLDAPFPTALGIIFFAAVFMLGVFKLLGYLCEKYFNRVSVGAYLLTAFSFVNCCGALFLVKRPDFYSIPIICAMSFIIWGIYLWIKGRDNEKRVNLYLFSGSLCCALAVGCRPQSVLMCVVAIPVFWEYFFKDKAIFKKKRIINLVFSAIPFIIVAAGIMYYNYIRFGSPFNFGSGYNLTTNDVTKRGFNIGRTGLGLFTYLLQTPKFTATFPYLEYTDVKTAYMGKTIYENCFGGLFAVTPILWFTFLIGKVKEILKEKKLFAFTALTIAVGLATVIADTQAGGLLQRYFSDFGYIFFLGAALVIFALYEKNQDVESNKNLNILLFISTIFSIVYTLCLVFSVSDVTIDVYNPTAFGKVKYLVEFWL